MATGTEKFGVGNHSFDYDLLVIGGGSAATRASRFSVSYGAKVAACELPYSPISTETTLGVLEELAFYVAVFRRRSWSTALPSGKNSKTQKEFGWDVQDDIKFNRRKLQEGRSREIERLNNVYKNMLTRAGVTILEGFARIIDPHTVEIKHTDGEVKRYTANHILIATGSRAQVPNIPGKELAITSDEGLSLPDLPKRVIILGAGYIGVEFAGIFSGMGAEVHLFYRKELPLADFDQEMRDVVARNLEARGINLHPKSTIVELQSHEVDGNKNPSEFCLIKKEEFLVDAVMFATGRKPNTKWLNLDAVGVEVDGHTGAVKVDEYSRTSVPSIWAAGNVTDRMMLTPVAIMEGSALAKTLFGGIPTKPDYENIPSAVFCQPPLSVVGFSEEAAIAKAKNDILVYTSSFNPMKNTISGRQEKTHMKLIVDVVTDKVLGASMCGPDAPEIIQGIAIALKCGATKAQFDSTVGIHPSAAEEFVTLRTPTRRVSPSGEMCRL